MFVRLGVPCWTHCAGSPAPPPSRSTRRGSSGIECRPVQRVGVPCLVWSALHLARPVLLPVLCSPSGCAGGWGLHLWGIWREPGVGWSTPRVEKIQKRRLLGSYRNLPTPPLSCAKHPYPHCQSQKFRPKTKRPLQRVCVLCYTCLTSLEREESVK